MEDRIYIHHLEDGGLKLTLQNHICKGCGLEPYFMMTTYSTGISKPKLMVDGWELINNMTYCPLCVRKEKIKKIMNR